jgi:hypothetical protein
VKRASSESCISFFNYYLEKKAIAIGEAHAIAEIAE